MKNTPQYSAIFFLTLAILFFCACHTPQKAQKNIVKINDNPMNYPTAIAKNNTINYFGTPVNDPYAWLENPNNPETQSWIENQKKYTNKYFQNLPFRDNLKEQLKSFYSFERQSAPQKEGDYYYFSKNNGTQNQSVIYRQKNLNDTITPPEVFIDPNNWEKDHASLNFFNFSKDKKYCAYGTSKNGSDWNEFFVLSTQSIMQMPDHLQHIKFSNASWYKNGFFYTRFPAPTDSNKAFSDQNQLAQIYYHTLGTLQSSDKKIWEDRNHPLRSYNLQTIGKNEQYFILSSSEGTSYNALGWCKSNLKAISWQPIVKDYTADHTLIDATEQNTLLILTNRNAPNFKIVQTAPEPNFEEEKWQTLVPEKADMTIQNVQIVNNTLVVQYMKDVSSRLYLFDLQGNMIGEIPMPAIGTVKSITGKKEDKTLYFEFESFMIPPTVYAYSFENQKVSLFFKPNINFDFEQYQTKEVWYKSKDSTAVHMFITAPKNAIFNGANPCLLYGYGGFNIPREPEFKIENLPFYAAGGMYAVANLRGGSEYGEKWHEAGMLHNKQNVFDDFIAAAQFLTQKQYTNPQKLAITGRSNGGLLIGAVLNQKPELFKAAIPEVGVMDMLRYQYFTIGWAWKSEFGSSENPDDFKYLYAYSPYHNISTQAPYPAILACTAQFDDRVVPAHSYKYIAQLQRTYKGTNPILIRIDANSGHGGGGAGKTIAQKIEEYADKWTFLFKELGMN